MLKYFGTDGLRGVVNEKLDYLRAYNVGKSLAKYIKRRNLTKNVIIGKDTRVSADMLSSAVACGLCDYGVSVKLVGVVPTGAVSYIANKLDVGAGVMITASHNAPNMNGIKLINNLGYKFSTIDEYEIEKYIDLKFAPTKVKGDIESADYLVDKYIDFLVGDVGIDLSGYNIAIDTAFGSNYSIAERVYKKLNANVIIINNTPSGKKINVNCGALNVRKLVEEVKLHKCDFGFAFDGDADRLVVVLSDGRVLGGDELLFVFANYLQSKNKLNSLKVVGTIMTNSGVEKCLNNQGIGLIRTDVGDRNVIETMLRHNYSLGGESSGHICISSLNTTCDALLNSLFLLKIVKEEKVNIFDVLLRLKRENQTIKNIAVSSEFRNGFDSNIEFKRNLDVVQKKYSGLRLVVRPSGTESVIRVMAEGNQIECMYAIEDIVKLISN